MDFRVELEREDDGCWIAEVPDLPGVLMYGGTREEAVARVQALALRVIAERLEHGEAAPEFIHPSSPRESVAERPGQAGPRCAAADRLSLGGVLPQPPESSPETRFHPTTR